MQPTLTAAPAGTAAAPSSTPTMSLLDQILPAYETGMVEVRVIPRPRAEVFRALQEVRFSEMRLARALMLLRTFGRGGVKTSADEPPVLAFLRGTGTVFCEEVPDREIAYGMVAQPWKPNAGFWPIPDRAAFAAFDRPTFIKIASNFSLTDVPGGTRVTCEIRNHGTDRAAGRKFRPYWAALGAGIRLVVKSWLAAVARRAGRALGVGRCARPASGQRRDCLRSVRDCLQTYPRAIGAVERKERLHGAAEDPVLR